MTSSLTLSADQIRVTQVDDVLNLLHAAGLVAFDSNDEESISIKNACVLLTAPSIDHFDPSEMPDFGKEPVSLIVMSGYVIVVSDCGVWLSDCGV